MIKKSVRDVRAAVVPMMVLAAVSVPCAQAAEDVNFNLAAGAEYTTGDYGGEASVDEFYIPLTATVDFERIALRLTVPFLSVRAPELTYIIGPDGQPIVGEGDPVTQGGLGDVLASITAFDVLSTSDGNLVMDLTGKVKFGTADEEKGLGTGEQDYSLQADVFRFFERATVMGTVGYAKRGDPDGYDLSDTFFASIGGSLPVSTGVRCGAFYDFRESSVPDADALQEISGWIATRIGEHGRAQFYALAGFSDSSPDWGIGLSISGSF
jgi:hypothetical protein